MAYALLCALLFSLSMVYATRSARAVGVERATLVRILVAAVLLGGWTLTLGRPLPRPAVRWLLLSGALGMGLGDIALFKALPLIGGALTSLLAQCLSVPLALAIELLWLGTRLSGAQAACLLVILVGIALSLERERAPEGRQGRFWLGVGCGLVAAVGTAVGAVMTRQAAALLVQGAHWDGVTAAFCRMSGGALVTLLWYRPVLLHWGRTRPPLRGVRRYSWTLANAVCGSVLGMAAMQRALASVPSSVVLAVAGTAPIGTLLLLWWFDGTRPTSRALVGGTLAVAGVVALQAV